MGKKSEATRSLSSSERRVYLIHQVAAWTTLVVSYYVHDRWIVPRFGLNQLGLNSMQDRLGYALRLLVPGIWTVLISILHVIYFRIVHPSARNPLSGNEHLVSLAHKVLANTIEQFLLHAVNLLILATYLSDDRLRLLSLMSALCFVGQIAFLVGFSVAPPHRAFGFTLTFVPNFGALGYNTWFLLTLGPAARLTARG